MAIDIHIRHNSQSELGEGRGVGGSSVPLYVFKIDPRNNVQIYTRVNTKEMYQDPG